MANYKQKGFWFLPLALLVMIGMTSAVFAVTAPGTLPDNNKLMSQKILKTNAWEIYTTNYGPFVKPQTGSGGFWPTGSGRGYIYGAGLWVGAQDASGNKIVACGYNPNSGGYEMGPVDFNDSYASYLSESKARVYLSTDPVDAANWPEPVIKSRQDSYARYTDQNPQFTFSGDKQLGIRVEQISYAWNYADNNDIIFFYFRVANISGGALSQVYVAPVSDCDIGDESGTSANDRTIFDYQRNLAIQFQTDPESGWPETGVVGFRYFESPFNNTGATVHVVDNEFSHDILPDSALGMTAFKIFTLEKDPSTDEERYLELTGVNYWDMINDAYDEWGANTPADKRFAMSSGPFNMGIGDTITTCIGVIGALDTTALKLASDVAQVIYDNDFELATPPAAPTLTIMPGDKCIRLSWDKRAEITPDPYWAKLPAGKNWYTYFSGTWQYTLPATQLLVDSFELVDNASANYIRIARGAPQPATGGDTLNAFYSQQELYNQYDFQGYFVFRASSQADLADAAKREYLGTLYVDLDTASNSATLSYSGGSGYMYDKVDNIKIVRDLETITYTYPGGGSVSIPKFDTIGTDRGLIYSLTDSNVVNGFGYWYGVSAYDYQSNVYFTHKCPTTLMSNPAENSGFVKASSVVADAVLPTLVKASVTGASDALHGGIVDYSDIRVAAPDSVRNDTFWLRWQPTDRQALGLKRNPIYRAHLYDAIISGGVSKDTLIDSIRVLAKFDEEHYEPDLFLSSGVDELPFGYAIYKPKIEWSPKQLYAATAYRNDPVPDRCNIDSFRITENPSGIRTYPVDSVNVQLNVGFFSPISNAWQWRGSDFEVRWKDTLTGLTAEVWDISNNILVPLETGVTKANMTKSSWCFNPTANTSSATILTSTSGEALGMQICGITVYFNKAGITLRRMDWPNRPETGDIWRIYCSGQYAPVEGDVVTFVTTQAKQLTSLSASLLDKINVVPNPYLVRANWDVSKNYPNIYFTNLPSKCTVRIYNIAGELMKVLNHEVSLGSNEGSEKWDMLTTFDKRVASGMYIYQVDAPGIGTKLGKFAIIK
ncbi:MAG: hypothetical protein RDU76_05810 [Candidatus Edwardsbacteria bacterium]|nr:hypothetical protein [Candidatus Edwardsbacteria bacterium]